MNKQLFRIINPIVRTLLRSPLHGLMSANTVLLKFKGRKSGRAFILPVSYFQQQNQIICCTAKDNIWWRNLLQAEGIHLVLRGKRRQGKLRIVRDDSDNTLALLRDFLLHVPRDARHAGVGMDGEGKPLESDLRSRADQFIFLMIDLYA
ncbi:MAG: hypothetical protein AAF699_16995 [Pseudomonadota bacterium]